MFTAEEGVKNKQSHPEASGLKKSQASAASGNSVSSRVM